LPAKPPQIDAVTRNTTLVTVTIGANDIGLAGIALSCFNLLPPPAGKSCKDTQTAGGVDRGARAVDSVADNLADTLEAIARVADEHDAEYVDFIGPGAGHDGCQLTRNWANVVVPGTTLGIVPIHPTALGEQSFARILEDHLAPDRRGAD